MLRIACSYLSNTARLHRKILNVHNTYNKSREALATAVTTQIPMPYNTYTANQITHKKQTLFQKVVTLPCSCLSKTASP